MSVLFGAQAGEVNGGELAEAIGSPNPRSATTTQPDEQAS